MNRPAAIQAVYDARREHEKGYHLREGFARWGSYAALPFVLLGMLVVPLFGGHFCPQEALPVLAAAGSLPFIGPAVRRWRTRKHAHHCCEPEHRGVAKLIDAVKADGFFATAGRKVGPPLPDIDVDPTHEALIGVGVAHGFIEEDRS